MNKQINNIAVKPKNEFEEKVIIKVFEDLGFKFEDRFAKQAHEDCIGIKGGDLGWWFDNGGVQIITLDELVWKYCAPDDTVGVYYHYLNDTVTFTYPSDYICDDYQLISTRPEKQWIPEVGEMVIFQGERFEVSNNKPDTNEKIVLINSDGNYKVRLLRLLKPAPAEREEFINKCIGSSGNNYETTYGKLYDNGCRFVDGE